MIALSRERAAAASYSTNPTIPLRLSDPAPGATGYGLNRHHKGPAELDGRLASDWPKTMHENRSETLLTDILHCRAD